MRNVSTAATIDQNIKFKSFSLREEFKLIFQNSLHRIEEHCPDSSMELDLESLKKTIQGVNHQRKFTSSPNRETT